MLSIQIEDFYSSPFLLPATGSELKEIQLLRSEVKKKGRRPTLPPAAVPSALRGLTSLFGMERGGPPRHSHPGARLHYILIKVKLAMYIFFLWLDF